VKLEQARGARARRYCFHYDEVAEAEAQGLPYVLVPRVLSHEEWEKKYCVAEEWENKYALPAQASVKRNSLPSAVGCSADGIHELAAHRIILVERMSSRREFIAFLGGATARPRAARAQRCSST
jgi:hypothetical protein